MTIERARELARMYFDEALNRGNLAVVDEILDPAFTLHVPPSLGEGPQVTGPDGFKQLVTALRAAFADLHFTVHDTTAADNVVMVSWTMAGTHQAEWQGIAATGRRVSLTGVDVFTLADGKILEERIHGDYLGFLRQLGAIA